MKRRHVETTEVLAGDHLSDQLNTAAGRVHQHLRDALQVPELAPQHHDVAQVQLSKAGQEGVADAAPTMAVAAAHDAARPPARG